MHGSPTIQFPERKTLARPALRSGGSSGQIRKLHVLLKAGKRWWDVELFHGHPVYEWLLAALHEKEHALLDHGPHQVEHAGESGLQWRARSLVAPGKLVISVKNSGTGLFVEIYGTCHGRNASRFKIDVARGILQIQEGCGGR